MLLQRSQLILVAAAALAAIATPTVAADKPQAKLAAGDTPPQYLGRQWNNVDVTIDLNSGKAYVISFWASWCAPCLQELPVLSNIQRIAGPERMQVIAVNIEDRNVYRKLESHIQDAGLTPAYDPGGKVREAYGVGAIPHMVIVGRDGRVSAVRIGYAKSTHEELSAALNQALSKEPVTIQKK